MIGRNLSLALAALLAMLAAGCSGSSMGTGGPGATGATGDDQGRAPTERETSPATGGGADASAPQPGPTGEDASPGTADDDAGSSTQGACASDPDRAVLKSLTAARAGCLSAGCALESVSGFSLSEPKLTACVAGRPGLADLSAGCRKCFVDISLCVAQKCSLLGRKTACTDVTKPDCDNPKPPSPSCDKCQAEECRPAFAACTGPLD